MELEGDKSVPPALGLFFPTIPKHAFFFLCTVHAQFLDNNASDNVGYVALVGAIVVGGESFGFPSRITVFYRHY